MKSLICCLFLTTVALFGAAPDSLGGKVYRSYQLLSGSTNAAEGTIILSADGRYTVLKSALGVVERPAQPNTLPEVHWAAIQEAPVGGRFGYEKTAESTGTLTLTPDGGGAVTSLALRFSSSTTGSTSPTGLSGLGGNAFYLSDLSMRGMAPASNVSMRGRVSEGRPLIMGFTIPGDSEREVLLRVIGPSLASFGVADAWRNASMQIYKGNSAVFGEAFRFPHWSAAPIGVFPGGPVPSPESGLRRIFDYVGAFALPSGSQDCAVVIRLAPGNYTVVGTAGVGDAGGEALIEMYALP